MANGIRREALAALRLRRSNAGLASVLVMACVICLVPTRGIGDNREDDARSVTGRYCSATAETLFRACGHAVQDDYWIAVAVCINVSDDAQREQCSGAAKASRGKGNQLCFDQLAWRLDACKSVGEDRYDPAYTSS
jgi:hypothetical protein